MARHDMPQSDSLKEAVRIDTQDKKPRCMSVQEAERVEARFLASPEAKELQARRVELNRRIGARTAIASCVYPNQEFRR